MATGSKLTSKAAGAGKSVAQALEGYPGVFHHIAGEHAEAASLIRQVAGTMEVRVRQDLFPQIRRSLLAHARAEEEVFYPTLRAFAELAGLVEQCLEDHGEVERFLKRLDVKDKSTKQWGNLFEQMMQAVDRHVEREENELFPRARELLGHDAAKDLEERFRAVEERPDPLEPSR